MTYRELLEQYKNGQLSGSEKQRVEEDIERQDAISDYLYENSSIPDFDDLSPASDAVTDTTDAKFVTMIEHSIRRAFVKLGVTVGVSVLVLTLCAVFLLPQVVSLFYYNPNKVVGRDAKSSISTTRMSLDLSVYTELFVPSSYRNEVLANSNGYGNYDIVIPQTASYTSRFTTVSGYVEVTHLLHAVELRHHPLGLVLFLQSLKLLGGDGLLVQNLNIDVLGRIGGKVVFLLALFKQQQQGLLPGVEPGVLQGLLDVMIRLEGL